MSTCTTCYGSGAVSAGGKSVSCPGCGGSGNVIPAGDA